MLTYSNERPDEIQIIGNKLYRNFNIEEIEVKGQEEGTTQTMYQYQSLLYQVGAEESAMERDVKKAQIKLFKQYLNDTGWYVERYNDPSSGNKEIPQEVLEKRGFARTEINRLEQELSIGNV